MALTAADKKWIANAIRRVLAEELAGAVLGEAPQPDDDRGTSGGYDGAHEFVDDLDSGDRRRTRRPGRAPMGFVTGGKGHPVRG